jgi:inorganic triphosphatase YgiF
MNEQTRPTETELKLNFPPEAERALADHPAFRSAGVSPPEKRRLVTTYFDTENEALKACGFTLRVRKADSGRIQTVKSEGDGALAAQRGEWEWPIDDDRPNLDLLQETPVAERLPSLVADDLQPIVVTDVVRTTQTLRLENNTIVEAAFDRGSVAAGKASAPICELELELLEGEPGALYRLALGLNQAAPLVLGAESKAARGFRLKTGAAPQAKKAVAPDLDPEISAAAAFRQILVTELGTLIANQPAARVGDAEGIHQMRVGIRRLRSALMLFAPHLEAEAAKRFQAELQRVGRIFGEARDWDVFCLEALPNALDEPENIGWIDLFRPVAQARREAAHADFVRALDAQAFTAMTLGLAAWAEDGAAHERLLGDEKLRRPLSHLAPDMLDRLQRKVDRRGAGMEELSGEELHALRKSLKKMRYGVEYLASLFSDKAVNAYLKHCKALQKSLGAINDAATAVRRAEELTENGRPDLAAAVGALAQSVERSRREAMKSLPKRWRAFEDEPRFWL